MINLFMNFLKLIFFTFIILLAGQIKVSDRRVCDHIGDMVESSFVKTPLNWISTKFSYSKTESKKASTTRSHFSETRNTDPEHVSDSAERSVLSGFLKQTVK